MLCWGSVFTLVSMGEEKLWIPSILINIQFEKEKTLEKREMTAHTQW